MVINKKSIIDCNEYEEELHNLEIEKFMEKIRKLPNYKCAVVKEFRDVANLYKEKTLHSCDFHDFLDVIEYCDIKNGIDLVIENNELMVIAYGQTYVRDNEWHFVETVLHILPYDSYNNLVNIVSLI